MDRSEVHSHVSVILAGSSNYVLWAQLMKKFLVGRRLWRIVTGDVVAPKAPVKVGTADPSSADVEAYQEKLED